MYIKFPKKLVDSNKRTYLHLAVSPYYSGSFRNLNLLKFLTQHCDLFAIDHIGRTAFSYVDEREDDEMSSIFYSQTKSSSKTKKLQKGATQNVISLPSTVVHSQNPWEINYDFYKDYEEYSRQFKKKQLKELENLKYEEAVELGLKPRPDKRVEGNLQVIDDEVTKRPFDVMLVKVELPHSMYSMNLFYKMQLLIESNKKLYILFTNWGRVGTQGQHQQTPFFRFEDAKKEFMKVFKEKTKNEWEEIASFEKKYRKYNLIKTSSRSHAKEILTPFDFSSPSMAKSILPDEFQQLMSNLTDNKMYQLAYSSFNISKEHLPFGNLQRDVLLKARDILNEIKSLLEKLQKSFETREMNNRLQIAEEISEKSGNYFELVPSSQYMETAIPSFNSHSINLSIRIVENLLDFEVASKILCAAQFRQKEIHPFDYCLRSLKLRMACVDPRSEEAILIHKYITESSRYKSKKLIKNIFAVSRPDEEGKFISLENRRLLWHGTKTENLLSILHKGLKIAPPSAEHTGSMFGNGIYFADFFDKAFNYCANHYFDADRRSMYILLCEVSLGKMKKLYKAEDIKALESNFNSVKGSGANSPNKQSNFYLNNGCMIPLGKLKDKRPKNQHSSGFGGGRFGGGFRKARSGPFTIDGFNKLGKGIIGLKDKKAKLKKSKEYHLNYNEFVVYNTNQVKLRYLIEINSNIVPE